ncbi:MAG: type II toxin-antitoxin system RelE/ParE family toxin [Clostridiales bacterium]|nr:type II toxin-antitoxin system RelE/ParE family toxin [Clostridiales bacterium]
MNTYRIRITIQARENLRNIRNYIEFELLAPLAAKNTIAEIKREIQSLETMPERIHLTPEQPWHDQGVHRARVRNYYIYFWIDEKQKTVQIISVIYVKRDQIRHLPE